MSVVNNPYRLPAEWEHQRAVMVTWPHEQTDWLPYLDAIRRGVAALVAAIADHEDVLLLASDAAMAHAQLSAMLTPAQMQRVKTVETPTDDTWTRDYGFITLLPTDGQSDALLLDFRFNAWGNKFPSAKDNAVNRRLSAAGHIAGCYRDETDFVLEGGSIDTDGRGTLFTTASCLLAPERNQPLTRRRITWQLKRRLHVDRVVWLHHGRLIGDDTDGHIDTLVRCAPNDTLLYVACSDPADAHFPSLQAMESELKQLRTRDGRPYRLLPLPLPAPIVYDGERLPATYANFLLVNGAVIMPTYGQPEADRQARETLQDAFPDRDVTGVDATVAIRQHGSLHCMTSNIFTR